jgi:uncharacterized protein (TIGR00645 family)
MSDNPEGPKPIIFQWMETGSERALFASRWLLAPIYLGLVVALIIVLVKFCQELYDLCASFIAHPIKFSAHDVVLGVLAQVDLALLGNLILIVILAGYENFVSKINVAEGSEDRPKWMGHIDFSGLKIKLIGSIVAISMIELLKDFLTANTSVGSGEWWRVGIHLTFLLSGVLFSVMDLLADKRNIIADVHYQETAERAAHASGKSAIPTSLPADD